jgi:hypothetical protein
MQERALKSRPVIVLGFVVLYAHLGRFFVWRGLWL